MYSTFDADDRRRADRLPARGRGVGVEPEQRQQSISDDWFSCRRIDHRLRRSFQETVDQNTVSNGRCDSASLVDPRMSMNC